MWTRGELKNQAKFSLRGKYWMAFAVSLLVSILGGRSSMFSWSFNSGDFKTSDKSFEFFQNGSFQDYLDKISQFFSSGIILFALLIGLFVAFLAIAFQIFVSTVVRTGGCRWFSRSREAAATPTIGQVFSLFKSGSYLQTVGSMLWMNLFLFLWSLLAIAATILASIALFTVFIDVGDLRNLIADIEDQKALLENVTILFRQIVPYFAIITGVSILFSIPLYIKTYSYRMTPWILADNPRIGFRRVLKLSMDLTRGHKLNILVLDLSFIGWFLLGAMACGVGVLFVIPYYNAVQAELYARLRQNGVNNDLCTMEEFGYVKVDLPVQNGPEPAAS